MTDELFEQNFIGLFWFFFCDRVRLMVLCDLPAHLEEEGTLLSSLPDKPGGNQSAFSRHIIEELDDDAPSAPITEVFHYKAALTFIRLQNVHRISDLQRQLLLSSGIVVIDC